jgi:hypothetical protein
MQGATTVTQVDADMSGAFLVGLVPAGTYTVIVHPLFDFADTVLQNVVVNSDQTTNLGTIVLAF